jgi:hypothetical protein
MRYPTVVLILAADLGTDGPLLMRSPWTSVVGSVHRTVDIFHAFFNKKINPKF